VARPELRETLLFVRSQAEAVTADEVAERFHVHRTVARGRLERLLDAGLLTAEFRRRTGRSGPGAGRPAKLYGVCPELQPLEFPPRRYEQLLGHLLDTVPELGREEPLLRSGVEFGRELAAASGLPRARGLRAAAERSCAALGELGFQACVTDESSADRIVICTPTCPVRPLVVANPEARAIDRGVWIGLVDFFLAGSSPVMLACETSSCLDTRASCKVLLEFESDDEKPATHPRGKERPCRLTAT
jgi:predicted ArsR family transcriptional regulator